MSPAQLRKLIASRLNGYCRRKRLSLNQFAQFTRGLSRPAVHLAASGRVFCRIDTLAKIAEGMGIKPCQLIDPDFTKRDPT